MEQVAHIIPGVYRMHASQNGTLTIRMKWLIAYPPPPPPARVYGLKGTAAHDVELSLIHI